jgi:hypothetical protein
MASGPRTSENPPNRKSDAQGVRWCQIASPDTAKFEKPCKSSICRSGTPYEQDLEHMPSLGPRQLYSLDTVFG